MKALKSSILLLGLALASCKNTESESKLNTDAAQSSPQTARCSQTTEVESIVVHETLLLKVGEDLVSGTYQFTTGERGSIQDAGFQHLAGKISETTREEKSIRLKLSEGSLSVYFDEEFAPEKKLTELKLDFMDKKVTFTLEGDARETVVGNCIFE